MAIPNASANNIRFAMYGMNCGSHGKMSNEYAAQPIAAAANSPTITFNTHTVMSPAMYSDSVKGVENRLTRLRHHSSSIKPIAMSRWKL